MSILDLILVFNNFYKLLMFLFFCQYQHDYKQDTNLPSTFFFFSHYDWTKEVNFMVLNIDNLDFAPHYVVKQFAGEKGIFGERFTQ